MTDHHLLAGKDAVRHSWRCHDRRVVERIERDPTGRAIVVTWCSSCGGTDLLREGGVNLADAPGADRGAVDAGGARSLSAPVDGDGFSGGEVGDDPGPGEPRDAA